MLTRERPRTPIDLPPQAALPPLTSALSRRAALFGAVTVAGCTAAALVPASVQAAPLSANDARLVAMTADLRQILADFVTLTKGDPRDNDKIPGYLALEDRRTAISDALFDVSPTGLAGLVAAADIVQQLAADSGDSEDQTGHGHNLACDVLRIIGGRA